jgi:hypothetical protein
MTDFDLRYVGYHVEPEDLKVNECTIRPTCVLNGNGVYPRLWFRVLDDEGQALDMLGVALAVNGSFAENGPGGRTWGFTRSSVGVWIVTPSINVLPHPRSPGEILIHSGEHPEIKTSSWHHTPSVVGVPDGEPWQ